MFVFKFIFVVYLCANCVFGLYVPSNDAEGESKSNDKKLIDDVTTIIKNNLQPNDKGVSSLDEFHVTNNDFNEIELIRLIPSVIEHLKTNRLSQKDCNILSQIYGNLWLIMDEESKRDHKTQKMNPILKLILQLKDPRKRDIFRRELMNDYRGNSVEEIRNGDHDIVDQPLRIKLGLNENLQQLSLPQRILRTIAMLISNITHYNYIAMDETVNHNRKNIKLRKFLPKNRVVHPNVIRLPRSSLQRNNNSKHINNNVGNDIDLYDSDEAAFYRQRVSSFDDNASIIELIKLAEIHRLRRQQKFNKNSISLIDKMYSMTTPSDNDEYYYDDEPESVNSLNEDDANDEEYEEDDEYDE